MCAFALASAAGGGFVAKRVAGQRSRGAALALAVLVLVLGHGIAFAQLGSEPSPLPEGKTVADLTFFEAGEVWPAPPSGTTSRFPGLAPPACCWARAASAASADRGGGPPSQAAGAKPTSAESRLGVKRILSPSRSTRTVSPSSTFPSNSASASGSWIRR